MSLRGSLIWIVLLVSLPANAQSTRTLSGRWSASTMRTSIQAEPWGAACGPKPSSASDAGGIVTITQQGKELNIAGLGRNFSTTTCWEPIANGRVIGHSAADRSWRTNCQSVPGDPRRSAVTTTATATDDRIDFVEVGQFEFVIGTNTCHAVMQRNRTYSLVEREGETRPVPEAPPAAVQADPPKQAVAPPVAPSEPEKKGNRLCSEPGPPNRIEVSPSRKLLRAGDSFTFRVRVLDKNGCPLERAVAWKAVTPTEGIEVSPRGIIKVLPNAQEGTTQIAASIQDRTVAVAVDVVSESRYAELLAAGTFNASGETQDQAVTTLTSSTIGTKAAVLENAAQKRRNYFIATISAIAALLAGTALWLGLSRRKPKKRSELDALLEASGSLLPEDNAPAAGTSALVCPTCHEEYPADQKFCAVDGNRLVALPPRTSLEGMSGGVCPICRHGFDPGITRCPVHDEELVPQAALTPNSPAAPTGRRICPICGTIYGPDGQFCGNDGATLVPIN